MSSEVSRASHTHQVPHMGLPHSEPVTSVSAVKAAPSGAQHLASMSASFMRHTRNTNAPPAITM